MITRLGVPKNERDSEAIGVPALESELFLVAIVDDHPVARRGLQSILAEAGDIEVSAAVATPAELGRGGNSAARSDVIMLDLYYGGEASRENDAQQTTLNDYGVFQFNPCGFH